MNTTNGRDTEKALIEGPLYNFRDGLDSSLPDAAIGIYTVWKRGRFHYVGIAGRPQKSGPNPGRFIGLKERLHGDWMGHRCGQGLGMRVWDRLITAYISDMEQFDIAGGRIDPDELTRNFVRDYLSYRFVIVNSFSDAQKIERRFCEGQTAAGKPFLQVKQPLNTVELGGTTCIVIG